MKKVGQYVGGRLRRGVYVNGARGSSVIDYVIVNEKMKHKVRRFVAEERVESDHASISIDTESRKER